MLLQEKYPIYTLDLGKTETPYGDVDGIIGYLRGCIEQHEIARYICEFDHLAHTQALADGQVAPEIQAAKHIVFCFGTHLPNPQVMAVRPRSIGVCDLGDHFVVSYMEAPMALANNAMEAWMQGLVREGARGQVFSPE